MVQAQESKLRVHGHSPRMGVYSEATLGGQDWDFSRLLKALLPPPLSGLFVEHARLCVMEPTFLFS